MVTKSKLRLALAAEKGVDFTKLKQQKKHKAALKRKQESSGASFKQPEAEDESGEEDSSEGEDVNDSVSRIHSKYPLARE